MQQVLGGTEARDVEIPHRALHGYDASSVFLSTMPDPFAAGRNARRDAA